MKIIKSGKEITHSFLRTVPLKCGQCGCKFVLGDEGILQLRRDTYHKEYLDSSGSIGNAMTLLYDEYVVLCPNCLREKDVTGYLFLEEGDKLVKSPWKRIINDCPPRCAFILHHTDSYAPEKFNDNDKFLQKEYSSSDYRYLSSVIHCDFCDCGMRTETDTRKYKNDLKLIKRGDRYFRRCDHCANLIPVKEWIRK